MMHETQSHPFHGQFDAIGIPDVHYLDYASATPVARVARTAMEPWFSKMFGNPSNRLHPMGTAADHALEQSRSTIARLIQVSAEDVTFTAGATEANNLLIRGFVSAQKKRRKIVYASTEHSCVSATMQAISNQCEVACLPVDANGQIDFEVASQVIDSNTGLVSIMSLNNETGIFQGQNSKLYDLARSRGAHLHVDAAQGFPRGVFDPSAFDSMVVSSSKAYGPKGAAALIVKRSSPRLRLIAQVTGGGQERNMRSGTQNIPAIVGFAKALEFVSSNKQAGSEWLAILEQEFLHAIRKETEVFLHGATTEHRVPGIMMISFPGVNAMKLVENTRTVCVSTGSACQTLQATASHVLTAMGVDLDIALAAIRVSFGWPNTLQEVRSAATILGSCASQLRKNSATLF